MSVGLVCRKVGMTRVFREDGLSVPVTVLEVKPSRITQIKTVTNDGYEAIQITTGDVKLQRVNKPMKGHCAKANVAPGFGCYEFTVNDISQYTLGGEFGLEIFTEGQYVDVTGISKGKGFAGTVKRWNFRTQDMTHGNSRSHRVPGSTGQNQTPGRVFKGKKMAGHMGDVRCTMQNQQVISIDKDNNCLLVKGPIPGAPGGVVIIRPAVKKPAAKEVQ